MGGYGSGGHHWGKRRVTAESCYRFDAGMVRGLWKAVLGETCSARWGYKSTRGEHCSAFTSYSGGALHLAMWFYRDDTEAEAQRIPVSFSPCRYGGQRAWLHCPHCGRRVFRLFLYPSFYVSGKPFNRFWCRECMCGGVSYELRNTKEWSSMGQTRAAKIKRKMLAKGGIDLGGDWWDFPDKPKWMRWHTYLRLSEKFEKASELAENGFILHLARRFPDILGDPSGPSTQELNSQE